MFIARGQRVGSAVAIATAVLLTACGGGETGEAPPTISRESPTAFFPNVPIPADASSKGMWSPVYNWPLISVHAVLMPDGRVLTYGTNSDGQQTGISSTTCGTARRAERRPPDAGQHDRHRHLLQLAAAVAADAAACFIAGGDNWTGTGPRTAGNNNSNLFDCPSNSIARGLNMNRPRWYSTLDHADERRDLHPGRLGRHRSARDPRPRWHIPAAGAADTSALDFMYPRNFVAPDGRVFGYDSNGRMYYMNTAGSGTHHAWRPVRRRVRRRRLQRGDVPARAAFCSSAASRTAQSSSTSPARTPVVTPTQSLSSQRRLVNATMLADGKVLATGGSQVWNQLTGVNNIAEIWNPQTGQWTQGAVAQGRACTTRTRCCCRTPACSSVAAAHPDPHDQHQCRDLLPALPVHRRRQRAPRPRSHRPDRARDRQDLRHRRRRTRPASAASRWSRPARRRTASTWSSASWTYVRRERNARRVQAPTRAADAPPGYYQLFVFDEAGVPSVAKILRIGIAADPNPAIAPALDEPRAPARHAVRPSTLQLAASDPNSDALTYTATGLPPGLSLDADHRPHHRHAKRGRQLQRGGHGHRRHQHRQRQLRLERQRRQRRWYSTPCRRRRLRRQRCGELHRRCDSGTNVR